jgi:hypothetical protein
MTEFAIICIVLGIISGCLGYLTGKSAQVRRKREAAFRESFGDKVTGLRLKYQDPDGFTAYREITTFEQLEMERFKLENHGIDYDLEYK